MVLLKENSERLVDGRLVDGRLVDGQLVDGQLVDLSLDSGLQEFTTLPEANLLLVQSPIL